MKKIGFIDYYLDEWHANNYPAWIEEECARLGLEYKLTYAWAEEYISPKYGGSTDEWCEKFGAAKCDTIEELCEKSDVIFILAPSDPEKHLEYARKVFPYGKPVYVDKTFAPNLFEAKEIYALAQKHNTPFFSTSALRYAKELDELQGGKNYIITGGGKIFAEYLVHTVEMAVILMQSPISTVNTEKIGNMRIVKARAESGITATIIYAAPLPFTVTCEREGKTSIYKSIEGGYFNALIADVLRFFETKTVSFDTNETLEVMRFRDAALASNAVETYEV